MKVRHTTLLLFLALLTAAGHAQLPYLGSNSTDEVIAAMTLDEKISLIVGTDGNKDTGATVTIGNSATLLPGGAGTTNGVERLGVPQIVFADGPAGLRIDSTREGSRRTYYCTHFPCATLMSSTWSTRLLTTTGNAMGSEAKHYGADILLAPSTNIQRNPLCGRNYEYYSEDPLLAGKICAAFIRGVQSNGVGTSLKHFALNNQETNRSDNNAVGSPRTFREIYLRPFEIAVKEAQPWTVMTSYNKINGTMSSERCDLVTEILRHEWGFRGMVMTDWFGGSSATAQVEAGNDLLMPGKLSQREEIKKAVINGHLSMELVDRNVKHILECVVKTPRLNGYTIDDNPDLKANAAVARSAASEGMVLLKNEKSTLPVKGSVRKAALFGRSAYDFIAGGSGSGNVNRAYVVNLTDGLENAGIAVDTDIRKVYEEYIPRQKQTIPKPTGPLAALLPVPMIPEMEISPGAVEKSARDNDIAIVTIGKTSGEFADRKANDDFNLSAAEQQLLDRVSRAYHKAGKKVVVILNVCGVVETKSWKDKADAILVAWLPGQEGGNAVADILTGKVSPSGRLPMTWPESYGNVPSKDLFPHTDSISQDVIEATMSSRTERTQRYDIANFYDTEYKDGIYVGYRYYQTRGVQVSYPFGYGLSYTTFKYGKPVVTADEEGNLRVDVEVKNTGRYTGKEVVEVYVKAPGKDMDKPERELRGFAKTDDLAPGGEQTVSIDIPYSGMASFNAADSQWQVEEGQYKVMVAKDAADAKPLTVKVAVRGGVTEKVRPCLMEEMK